MLGNLPRLNLLSTVAMADTDIIKTFICFLFSFSSTLFSAFCLQSLTQNTAFLTDIQGK